MTYTSSLLRLLEERGYIHQMTDAEGLDALAAKQVVPGYIGFDATAPSLHVGSLVQIMLLRRLQQAGHKPVVLMGGGTTRIGDPTGRDESRKMLSDATIEANIASIRTIFERFLTFGDGPTDAVMVNNHDWLGKLGYIQLLQEVGSSVEAALPPLQALGVLARHAWAQDCARLDLLADRRFLTGPTITEADWRLFVTLIRFDPVYVGHFKCNQRQIAEYPNLSGYVRDLYQQPGIAGTVDFDQIKRHYYMTHPQINPTGVVPMGPLMDLDSPPGREGLTGSA